MRFQLLAGDVEVARLVVFHGVAQHVDYVCAAGSQVAGLALRRGAAVADEIVQGFGHRRSQAAHVAVEFRLGDPPALAPGVEGHHRQHLADVDSQAAVVRALILNQVNQHPFFGGRLGRRLAPETSLHQRPLPLDECQPLVFVA